MWFNIDIKLIAGALAGALVGYLIGYARSCGTTSCDARQSVAMRIFYVIAMAVFGAGFAWYLIHR